jgi:uncharacterized membrane protein
MQDDTHHSRLLTFGIWTTGLGAVAFMLADAVTRPPVHWLALMPAYCLAAFALLHSFTFLGERRALWFLALGMILPFTAEYLSANFGAVFGGQWFARAQDLGLDVGVMLPGGIPLGTVFTWYAVLYLAFVSAVYLLRTRRSEFRSFVALPLAGALLVTLWQLVAGPAAVSRAMTGFSGDGFFQRIPLSSFAGWFATTMLVTLFFQSVEPGAVDASRFKEPRQGLAPMAIVMFGTTVLHASAVCIRMNATGVGWIGVVVFLVFALAMAARSRPAATVAHLQPAAGT